MAERWLRIRVVLVSGQDAPLDPAPGRVMLVPPTATFADLGLGVDLALGRWDVTQHRTFLQGVRGRHETRSARRIEIAPDLVVHGSAPRRTQFEYVFDKDQQWVHECLVEDFASAAETQGLAPIPVPIDGWGSIPDQYGRTALDHDLDHPELARPDPDRLGRLGAAVHAPGEDDDEEPDGRRRRRRLASTPLDLKSVRAATVSGDVAALVRAIDGRDLGTALQQVGGALLHAWRGGDHSQQTQLRPGLRGVHDLLERRGWDGDDVLAEEIDMLLTGTERRARTLAVSIEDIAEVMSSGGDDPGGYLHLDSGEVVHAFLRHGYDDLGEEPEDDDDNLWIYLDHDGDAEWADMAAFAAAAPAHLSGILTVAIQGKGAFARFRRTVNGLDLWSDWQVFSDDRVHGRARAHLRSQGIRPI